MIIHRSGVKLRGLCPGFVVHQSFWGQSANKRVQQRRVSTGINNKLNSATEVPGDSCRDSGGVCVDIVDNPPISRGQWPVDSGHTESGGQLWENFSCLFCEELLCGDLYFESMYVKGVIIKV